MQRRPLTLASCNEYVRPAWRGRWFSAGAARALAVGAALMLTFPAARATSHVTPAAAAVPGALQLTPSQLSPQPVGTSVTWTVTGTDSIPLVYQFGVASAAAGPFTVVRDYSPRNTFVWAPLQQGTYYIQVTAKEGYTAATTSSTVAGYVLTSRVNGTTAVIKRTANPLVALYSAPACTTGQIKVAFRRLGSTTWIDTNAQPCQTGVSRSFLVAGMLARTTYQMVSVVVNGSSAVTSTAQSFTTGSIPSSVVIPRFSVPQPAGPQSDVAESIVFHDLLANSSSAQANPIATNLQGQVLWYATQADLTSLWPVRIQQVPGPLDNIVFVLGNDGQQSVGDNVLRTIDLAGDHLQETSVQAINPQLTAMGQRDIYGFSHDALQLPNGDTAVFAYTEDTITTTPIMGDMLVVLNSNFQVAWAWDAFQHLDPLRGPTLGETCATLAAVYCPVPGYPHDIDWTHANSIDYSPSDGNLTLSLRDQDWVIKINYANGTGDGSVLWRMGPGGDFSIVPLNSSDPYPWFSHQHDANYIDGTTLEVFDDANTRCATLPAPCHSRGQVYTIDEQNKVATQTVNADLGNFSPFLGAAQRLSNGNYNFSSGFVTVPPPPYGQAIEVLPNGTKVFVQQINTVEYRAWRLFSMYSTINPPCPSCSARR